LAFSRPDGSSLLFDATHEHAVHFRFSMPSGLSIDGKKRSRLKTGSRLITSASRSQYSKARLGGEPPAGQVTGPAPQRPSELPISGGSFLHVLDDLVHVKAAGILMWRILEERFKKILCDHRRGADGKHPLDRLRAVIDGLMHRALEGVGPKMSPQIGPIPAVDSLLADPAGKMGKELSLVQQDTQLPAQRWQNRWIAHTKSDDTTESHCSAVAGR
jgi:hypothetical protein